jgi:hypothetical protein
MAPGARFTDRYQVRLSQVGKMPRYARLRHVEDGYDISHAKFTIPQHMEDAQSRPVGKRTEHEIDGSTRFVIIHKQNAASNGNEVFGA